MKTSVIEVGGMLSALSKRTKLAGIKGARPEVSPANDAVVAPAVAA